MTSFLRSSLIPLIASAAGAALLSPAPASAADGGEGRAVAECRAALLAAFPDGAVRNYRVREIAGNARRTRVSFFVTADRRYTFECAAGADGSIVTAELSPPRSSGAQLAAGQR